MNSFLLQQHQAERKLLNSTEFSQLFLDDDSASNLSIPFSDLIYGKKIGSGGFKDCYEGKTGDFRERAWMLTSFCFRLLQRGKLHK